MKDTFTFSEAITDAVLDGVDLKVSKNLAAEVIREVLQELSPALTDDGRIAIFDGRRFHSRMPLIDAMGAPMSSGVGELKKLKQLKRQLEKCLAMANDKIIELSNK